MILAIPFFGQDARWLKLLAHWFDQHAASRTKVPAVVITDDEKLVTGFPVLRVDTTGYPKRGHLWDRKGAIVAEATQYLGRVLVCDVDAFIQHDPEPILAKLPDVILATREDGWKREVHWLGCTIVQRQAGVMWFGEVKERRIVARWYREAFAHVGQEYAADEWREQLTWTLVSRWAGSHELPMTLNHSHHLPGAADACIVHEHGETKWRRIA